MNTDETKTTAPVTEPEQAEHVANIEKTMVMQLDAASQDTPDRTIVMQTGDANPDKTIRLSAFTQTNAPTAQPSLVEQESGRKKKRSGLFSRNRGKNRDVNETIETAGTKKQDPVIVDTSDVSGTFPDLEKRYSMQQIIAQGHHIKLYKCKDSILQRSVAMYIPDEHKLLDDDARMTMIRESEICAQLDHPSILPIYGIYTDYRGAISVPNKLLDGMILRLHLERISAQYRTHGIRAVEERKSQRERLQIFLDICNAVEYAHSRNIMHGNLTPRRVFIGEYHEIYVAGWSVARHIVNTPPDPIRLETPEGTPFTAPEFFEQKPTVDTRSDVYSLGMILYELMTLRIPYGDLTQEEIRKKLQDGESPEIEHRFRCSIDSDMRAMILKAIAINPRERYQTVRELSDDVRRYLDLKPLSFKKQSFAMRYTRFILKHQYGFFGMILAILLAIATLITLTLFLMQTHAEENRMNEKITFNAFASCSSLMNQLMERSEQIQSQMNMCAFHAEQLLDSPKTIALKEEAIAPIPADGNSSADFLNYDPVPNGANASTVSKMQPMRMILGHCFKTLNGNYAYSHDNSFLLKIELLFRDGTVLSYPRTEKSGATSAPEWRKKALQLDSGISLLSPEFTDYFTSPTVAIPFALPLRNAKNESIGAIVFLISNDAVARLLSSAENSKAGIAAQCFALLPEGKIVYELINGNPITGAKASGMVEPGLLKLLTSGTGFGKEIRKESPGEFIYCWNRLTCADKDLIYYEKISLDSYRAMMNHEEE